MPTDPLELARVEYRNLLKRFRVAESERIRLNSVVESALCVLKGDGFPEVLADHELVALAKENLGPAAQIVNENMRLRDALQVAIRWIEVAHAPPDERWRLVQQLRRSL